MALTDNPATNENSTQGNQTLEFNSLIIHYGKAMARVGQVEEQNDNLAKKLAELLSIESNQEMNTSLAEKEKALTKSAEIIAGLRVNMDSLNAEISDTKHKLELAIQGNYTKLRRHHRSQPWWQFWKRMRRK